MRLSKIKLAGFKSFVDPTTLPLPHNLTAILGPNGCGKSNVIDAVRWVMGESSAKHLRGDSMADVIFNGSGARKPVSRASVELVFDNSDRSLGGQYAQYNEIAIKREVGRDGQSQYYLNSAKCRRRDITDIFLGTGLGPRSYAIIEQGTISRLIEAKPEELRIFLEEAAGISKYKERRRDTENRIRHTEENLDRLNDIRNELEKQLERLDRQAKTAEKYKACKTEEREQRRRLFGLRLRDLNTSLTQGEGRVREQQIQVESATARQRTVETELEQQRDIQIEANDQFNAVQARFYKLGADISRQEQDIRHIRELRETRARELKEADSAVEEMAAHIKRDDQQLNEVEALLARLEPSLQERSDHDESSRALLDSAETSQQQWQEEWDRFSNQASEAQRAAELEKARIEHTERELSSRQERLERLDSTLLQSDPDADSASADDLESELKRASGEHGRLESELQENASKQRDVRQQAETLNKQINAENAELQQLRGRLSSLQTLQEAALGKGEDGGWLAEQQLEDAPRLAELLEVKPGWETAVEAALQQQLDAVCVADLESLNQSLLAAAEARITLASNRSRSSAEGQESHRLLSKLSGPAVLADLLSNYHVAEDRETALRRRKQLQPGERIVTREGDIVAADWLRVGQEQDAAAGLLAREQEVRQLEESTAERSDRLAKQQQTHSQLRAQLQQLGEAREQKQKQLNAANAKASSLRAEINATHSRVAAEKRRREQAHQEREKLLMELKDGKHQLGMSRRSLEDSLARCAVLTDERDKRLQQRAELQEQMRQARQKYQAERDATQSLTIQIETQRGAQRNLAQNLSRMRQQITALEQRQARLREKLAPGEQPMQTRQAELDKLLSQRVAVDAELKHARTALETVDAKQRELNEQRQTAERAVEACRQALESARLAQQESRTRRDTVQEQAQEAGFSLEQLAQGLADDAKASDVEQTLEQLQRRIERLGPINLAAIDEHKQEAERKHYLDSQHQDLVDALATLTDAIEKIDRETRARFKETFDKVDAGLRDMFPRLFGGGHAQLEMTGNDLLSTGVHITARPPGKRNSSIHLLSGGEKALTAVAMVFAIFELNPAPFCMLDEVDAPLDDANVGRFSRLVKEMSEHVQFIFISHNKITMEIADQLSGVTMQEAGVSRLVAVNMDEAMRMAS